MQPATDFMDEKFKEEIRKSLVANEERWKRLEPIVLNYEEMADFKRVGKRYLKLAGVIAGFLGAAYVLKQSLGDLIRFFLK